MAGADAQRRDDRGPADLADPPGLVEPEPRRPDLWQLRPRLGPGTVQVRCQQLHHHRPGGGAHRVGRLARRLRLRPDGLPVQSHDIIDFVFVWNDLLLALTLLDRAHQPLTVGLANLQTPHLAQEDLVAAGSIMAILPPLLLFAALNRFYVRGLFAGATKG
jgi:hypothetical protein